MTMQYSDYFDIQVKDDIIFMTMNAPHNNIMTEEFLEKFILVSETIEKYSDMKGLIISGAGRHFSSGADVDALIKRETSAADNGIPETHIRQKHAFKMLGDLPYPVISAVKGFCIGSGSEIAINSHIRICEPSARIGQPESTFGILPALGGVVRTAQICGFAKTTEIVMTGELFNAEKAYEIGWADILCEKNQSIAVAENLIRFIYNHNKEYSQQNIEIFLNDFRESGYKN